MPVRGLAQPRPTCPASPALALADTSLTKLFYDARRTGELPAPTLRDEEAAGEAQDGPGAAAGTEEGGEPATVTRVSTRSRQSTRTDAGSSPGAGAGAGAADLAAHGTKRRRARR